MKCRTTSSSESSGSPALLLAQQSCGQQVGRRTCPALAGQTPSRPGNGFLEHGVHTNVLRSISAKMPISRLGVFSVQATSRAVLQARVVAAQREAGHEAPPDQSGR